MCRRCRPEPSYVACLINSGKQAGNVCRLLQLIIQPSEDVIVSRRCQANLVVKPLFEHTSVCVRARAGDGGLIPAAHPPKKRQIKVITF